MTVDTSFENLFIIEDERTGETNSLTPDDPVMTLSDALAITQMLEDHSPHSLTDGWEERARDVQPGRGYEMETVVDRAHRQPRGLGHAAVQSEIGMSHLPYGMPRLVRGLGSFAGRQQFRRY